ncbi:RNA polymerase sigma factor [Caloramator australicus]|uniref:RNA polymerase, sigma-24 subunit, ECF subfamily n=1 Tax=Caloramator australicus RC3 TaxID=857293 RepID=G0V404_9CLOT|nr:sigma-70 family RNA polymerase sigma factor [Caloramator australicus]CCC57844.1 RNA polymerase, sigma-24 subunit, ECF subfamily [Caloramator australicus RC3]
MEETLLIQQCKENDIDAFESLFKQYENKIYNIAYYILKNEHDAMDVTQEVALKIYRSISNFKGDSKLSTWIYRITYNTCLDYIKKRKEDLSLDEYIAIEGETIDNTEDTYESNELRNIIKNCILKLNEDFRTIIVLRDVHGFSYQEIAGILNIEVGTVKSRLNRAREALKKELIKNGIVRGQKA